MKTKFTMTLTLFMALIVQLSFAQQKTVSGTVSDENGLPLIGATVIVAGTSSGTTTDFDGNYKINANAGDVLNFSYVGYSDQNITVGASNTVNTTLQPDNTLDEVVVTAFGKSREKKALGYAVQDVKGDQLEENLAGNTNLITGLKGLVAGIDIVSQSGDVGAPTSTIIRGVSSLTGTNQALYVVDGTPINNDSFASYGGGDEINGSNRAGDIDFTNVESITILKGGAATTLYGERGSNGVVVITTKKGTDSGKLNVKLNSTFSFSEPNRLPEFTDKFARGRNGAYSNVTHWSWGAAYANNPTFPDGTNTDLDADGIAEDVSGLAIPFYANNYKNWFRTAVTKINNVSFSGSNDKGNFYMSYTRTDNDGIVPNSSLKRNSFNVNGSYKLSDKLTVGSNINFITTETNKAASGINGWGDGLGYWHHMWDINRPWKDANGERTWFSTAVPDPNWIVYEDNELSNVNRLLGNVNLNYFISDWFNVSAKISVDTYSETRDRYRPNTAVNSAGRLGDAYNGKYDAIDTNSQFILSGDGQLTDNIGLSYLAGTTVFESRYKSLLTEGDTEILPNFYNLSNYVTITATPYDENYRLVGAFGEVTFDYKDTLYLGLTGRNDWSSTLPASNNSYFYPSINTSLLFSKLIDSDKILSFGKLRGSLAQTGKSADPYRIRDVFIKANGGNNVIGLPSFTASNIARNPELRPEISTQWEVGLELKLLENKIGLDATYYNILSTDQIIEAGIGSTTGYTRRVINAGDVRNKGVELLLSLNNLYKISDEFSWGLNFNFTKNENIVESLGEDAGDTDQIQLGTGWWSSTQRVAKVGYSSGTILGRGYQRNDNGDILVSDSGLPLLEDGLILGDVLPDWTMGISPNFKYKNFGLNLLFDIKKGGDVINDSEGWWVYSGLSKTTEDRFYSASDPNANATTIINGVNVNSGQQNNVVIPLTNNYYHTYVSFNDEELVENASWIRLRNISLSYKLPKKHLAALGLSNLSVAITGNNLWLDTKYNGKDPELTSRGITNNSGYDVNGAPATKSYTFNIKFGF